MSSRRQWQIGQGLIDVQTRPQIFRPEIMLQLFIFGLRRGGSVDKVTRHRPGAVGVIKDIGTHSGRLVRVPVFLIEGQRSWSARSLSFGPDMVVSVTVPVGCKGG